MEISIRTVRLYPTYSITNICSTFKRTQTALLKSPINRTYC
nr:MAG TPA: hypothetical protein [Caudoviricetes sp.]